VLIAKPLENLTHDDIEGFALTHDENIRVEYKENFDSAVRDKIAKILSSFANSQGGVLIIGIRSKSGRAVPPIEGFDEPPREEPRLTIENICLSAINPPLSPRVQVVRSNVGGKVFVVVETESSAAAPHALENSTRVYIRTGDASNPFTGASVAQIQELFQRRSISGRRWEQHTSLNEQLLKDHAQEWDSPRLRVSIGPQLPQQVIAAPELLYDFVRTTTNQSGLLAYPSVQRYQGGVFCVKDPGPEHKFANFSEYGILFFQVGLREDNHITGFRPGGAPGETADSYYFWQIVPVLRKVLRWASSFYKQFSARAELAINISLDGLTGQPFLLVQRPDRPKVAPTGQISANYQAASEELEGIMRQVIEDACYKLHWGFGGGEPLTKEMIKEDVVKVWNM